MRDKCFLLMWLLWLVLTVTMLCVFCQLVRHAWEQSARCVKCRRSFWFTAAEPKHDWKGETPKLVCHRCWCGMDIDERAAFYRERLYDVP